MDKFFNPFPNHFHKSKNAEYEVVEKRVAWKFCELLVVSTLTFGQMLDIGGRKGWNNCYLEFKVTYFTPFKNVVKMLWRANFRAIVECCDLTIFYSFQKLIENNLEPHAF